VGVVFSLAVVDCVDFGGWAGVGAPLLAGHTGGGCACSAGLSNFVGDGLLSRATRRGSSFGAGVGSFPVSVLASGLVRTQSPYPLFHAEER